MIIHTLINKCNTIIEDSKNNLGLNPVAELNVGDKISRIILNFDINDLKKKYKNNEISLNNIKHKIKMTNCGNINLPMIYDDFFSKKRASSFDVIAFKIPLQWDEGKGFDYNGDYVKEKHKKEITDGSNWFQARNNVEWFEEGIFSNKTLMYEYENNYGKTESLIIGIQHFDYGIENLDLDITEYVNDVILEKIKHFGIGIAFIPVYEESENENKFISFFTNHTNTFFHPYIETIDNNIILDNRYNFHLNIKNKLYLFVSDNGEYINLDKLPTCTINDIEYEVKQGGKGAYYIELMLNKGDIEPETILYDKWSNLLLNGEEINDIEMEFVVLPFEGKINIGKINTKQNNIIPQLSGINDSELIKIGDIREVLVEFIEEYSYGSKSIPTSSEYRIYVKENDREIDVYPFQQLERRSQEHSFLINTNELIPNVYHVDIKIKQGRNIKIYDNVLKFKIIDNVTNYYI